MRRKIRLLPPDVQNRIAAGEVVERPSSVLKELMENSLDAVPSSLDIRVERGGQGLILVQDDGWGIDPDELEAAVTRHATSKVDETGDLFALLSYGFRGEALAGIGSVSSLRITSLSGEAEKQGSAEGSFIEVVHGEVKARGPAAMKRGTRVEVRDLFANVPARLKFLKSESAEAKRCRDVFSRLSVARTDIGFTYTLGGRELFRFMPGESLEHRLAAFWPPALLEGAAKVNYGPADAGDGRVWGLAGSPLKSVGRSDKIWFYVNGRPVTDRVLHKCVTEAYKGRLLSREYPWLVLFIELPSDEVDVNVHPAKAEVRFRDERHIFSLVRRALESALVESFSTAGAAAYGAESAAPYAADEDDYTYRAEPNKPFIPDAVSGEPFHYPEPAPESGHEADARHLRSATGVRRQTAGPQAELELGPVDGPRVAPELHMPAGEKPIPHEMQEDAAYLGCIADTYLVLRLNGNVLALLDQHAAHERVLYNMFKATGDRVESRPLLLPLEMVLHPSEFERLQDVWSELLRLGFKLETQSGVKGYTLLIHGVPGSMEPARGKELLREIGEGRAKSSDELTKMAACKSAIKAGQALAGQEVHSLLSAWMQTEERWFCPHGRPVILRWNAEELEKMFKRRG